jgi:hypothetical protein
MQFVSLDEALKYEQPDTTGLEDRFALTCEIASRLKELDSIKSKAYGSTQPMGVRLINRLAAIQRRSHGAYNLILDLLSEQVVLSQSLKDLGKESLNAHGKPTSKQAYLQKNRKEIEIINELWPEIGLALKTILTRRKMVDGVETWAHVCIKDE